MRSTELLAQVSKTTSTILGQFGDFLTQFAESGRRANEGSRRNLLIAVWTLFVTAALTAIGVGIGYVAYRQDTDSNLSNEKWQQEVALVLKNQVELSEQSIRTLSVENAQLRHRLEGLEAKFASEAEARKRRTDANKTSPSSR